jgi:hypothetical protein
MDMRPQGGKDVLGPSEPLQWPVSADLVEKLRIFT